jgi:hypothetical protein
VKNNDAPRQLREEKRWLLLWVDIDGTVKREKKSQVVVVYLYVDNDEQPSKIDNDNNNRSSSKTNIV